MSLLKSRPPPEDFEKRFKIEQEPEQLVPFKTMRQTNEVYIGPTKKNWTILGIRYSTAATKKIEKDIEEEVTNKK